MSDMSDKDPASRLLHGFVKRPFVLLMHEGSEDGFHFDWLCAVDENGEQPLQGWRIPDRLDLMSVDQVAPATPMPPHRPRYLEFEGWLSDDRGVVTRVASGHVRHAPLPIDTGIAMLEWTTGSSAGRTQILHVHRRDEDDWILQCAGWSHYLKENAAD